MRTNKSCDFDSFISMQKNNLFLKNGINFLDEDDDQAAITEFTKAIEFDCDCCQAYYYRGLCKNNLGKEKESLDDFSMAIEINPNYADAYNMRGLSASDIGDIENIEYIELAICDFKKTIEIDPDHFWANYNLGNLLFDYEKYEEAIKYISKGLKLSNCIKLFLIRGRAYKEVGDTKKANDDFERAISTKDFNDYDESPYKFRGDAKFELSNLKGACEDWENSIKHNEPDSDLADDLLIKYCK